MKVLLGIDEGTSAVKASLFGLAGVVGDAETVLDFRILGTLEVRDGDQRLQRRVSPRQRALLAILVLHRGEVLSSDRLIDQLWGARPPLTAAKIIQGYISQLRKILGDGTLVTRGGGYELAVDREQVDAERFLALAGAGREALAAENPAGGYRAAHGIARALARRATGRLRVRAVRSGSHGAFGGGSPAGRRGPHRRRPRAGTRARPGRGARAAVPASSEPRAPVGSADFGAVPERPSGGRPRGLPEGAGAAP